MFSSQRVEPGTLERLPWITRRKVGMTSSHHGLYAQGDTRATMGCTEGSDAVMWSGSQKAPLSSDCSLQPDYMKPESLVIANQHVAVNTFPGLVHTARHTMEVGGARSGSINRVPKAKSMTGGKS